MFPLEANVCLIVVIAFKHSYAITAIINFSPDCHLSFSFDISL